MSDLSPSQVAESTGLSRDAIYRAIRRGELKAYKVCERVRVEPADLEQWKQANRVRAHPEGPMVEPLAPARAREQSFTQRARALR